MVGIERHSWPGNVRELINAVKRASIMADGQLVGCADVGLPATEGSDGAISSDAAPLLDLRQVREAAERQAVLTALARTAGNVARTAELLGVSRPTLYDLMNRLSIRQQMGG